MSVIDPAINVHMSDVLCHVTLTLAGQMGMSPDHATGPFNNPDLLFCMIGRCVSRKSTIKGKEAISVEATRTAESIRKWGKEKDFDIDQQKSFEAMGVASFVLTFHNDLENSCYDSTDAQRLLQRENSAALRHTRLDLENSCHKKKQLLLFLDGGVDLARAQL
jgi:hypothetical protein